MGTEVTDGVKQHIQTCTVVCSKLPDRLLEFK